jgi:hypothetical protein
MAQNGVRVIDQVVRDETGGSVSQRDDTWRIPK